MINYNIDWKDTKERNRMLQPKWNKYWAVLQQNTLYIYLDQSETQLSQV